MDEVDRLLTSDRPSNSVYGVLLSTVVKISVQRSILLLLTSIRTRGAHNFSAKKQTINIMDAHNENKEMKQTLINVSHVAIEFQVVRKQFEDDRFAVESVSVLLTISINRRDPSTQP